MLANIVCQHNRHRMGHTLAPSCSPSVLARLALVPLLRQRKVSVRSLDHALATIFRNDRVFQPFQRTNAQQSRARTRPPHRLLAMAVACNAACLVYADHPVFHCIRNTLAPPRNLSVSACCSLSTASLAPLSPIHASIAADKPHNSIFRPTKHFGMLHQSEGECFVGELTKVGGLQTHPALKPSHGNLPIMEKSRLHRLHSGRPISLRLSLNTAH